MKLSYLGDEYSHSYVPTKYFQDTRLKGFSTITEVIESVSEDISDACIVPIENSIEGTVTECVDTLVKYPLYCEREFIVPIHHALVGQKGAKLEDIKKVYSHPQAIGQCRNFLNKNKLTAIAVESTSEALKIVRYGDEAAIARLNRPEQEIIVRDIEDFAGNSTRFVVLSKKPFYDGDKVSIIFTLTDRPGALLEIMQILYDKGVNLTKVESRPNKTSMGKYIFYVDFLFEGNKETMFEILDAVGKKTTYLKFIGKYFKANS